MLAGENRRQGESPVPKLTDNHFPRYFLSIFFVFVGTRNKIAPTSVHCPPNYLNYFIEYLNQTIPMMSFGLCIRKETY